MKINVEKILKEQAQELIKDANFAYSEYTEELNEENAHMIAQKTILRVNVIESFLKNVRSETDIQKSTIKLSEKILKQVENDIDYMYPNGEIDNSNSHLVMQLIKRTGEDLSNFLECFEQKQIIESNINYINIIKEQFIEYNNDIDYAYPNNNYEEENAHIVIQGLLGKSEFLYNVLENIIVYDKEEKQFKAIYKDKLSGLIELLNTGYNADGYYKENGHNIFSNLIEGLKVELKDLESIKEQEEIVKTILSNDKMNHENQEEEIKTNKEENEEKPSNSEDIKKKIKNLM